MSSLAKGIEFTEELTFYVNGKKQILRNFDFNLTLLTYLRNYLGLRGTKNGCSEGGCGSCTVTVSKIVSREDGVKDFTHLAINACLTKISSLHLTAITTIEGLGTPEKLHPVQERLCEHHATQCGFCSPGVAMSISSELRYKCQKGEWPDIEDFRLSLQGNLCRCTGYRPILEAASTFCKSQPYGSHRDPREPVELFAESKKMLKLIGVSGEIWFHPTGLDELKQLQKMEKSIKFVGGGTGGYMLRQDRSAEAFIHLEGVWELKQKQLFQCGTISIGSAVTLAEMRTWLMSLNPPSAITRALCDALRTLASPQVRNVATVGGNVMWHHPCSDLMTIYRATGCQIKVLKPDGTQVVLFLDDKFPNLLGPNFLILELIVPACDDNTRVGFFRQARRAEFDLAIATACFFLQDSKPLVVTFGGMEMPAPVWNSNSITYAANVCKILSESKLERIEDSSLLQAIKKDAFFNPEAPEDYSLLRLCLLACFTKDFLQKVNFAKGHGRSMQSSPQIRSLMHLGSIEQFCGTAKYVDDLNSSTDELALVLIQGRKAHAEIRSIDFSKALALDGIVCSVDGSDIPKERNCWGFEVMDEPVFPTEVMEYKGQVIAALVCRDLRAGRRAAELVEIRYGQELPAFTSIEEAKLKAPVLVEMEIEKNQLTEEQTSLIAGTVNGTVRLGAQEHFYLEPHVALVVPQENGELVVHAPTQNPYLVQKNLAHILDIPMNKITVKTRRIGGAFGGKERMQAVYMAAVAAMKVRSPLRVVFSRTTDMEVTGQRHSLEVDYEADFDSVGRMLRTNFQCHVNGGFTTDCSWEWIGSLLLKMDGGYTLKNFNGKAKAYKTNLPSSTAFRGFGGPEGQIVIETVIDHISHVLNCDSMQIREMNMSKEGDELHLGDGVLHEVTLDKCWNECRRVGKYEEKKAAISSFNAANKRLKRGMSFAPIKQAISLVTKAAMQGTAYVRIFTDGSVLLSHGGVEMGQGLHTKIVQVASRALEIPAHFFYISDTSTDAVANASPTSGSTGTDLNGNAVRDACTKLRERIAPYKESNPTGGWVTWVKAAYEDRVNLQAVGRYESSGVAFDPSAMKGQISDYWTFGAGIVVVEVDCHTGVARVLSADIVMDVGTSLSPAIDRGQIEGAFVQGMGYVTNEQVLYHPKTGELMTKSPSSYKIPTVADIPVELNVSLLQQGSQRNPGACYGSKGIGEPGILISAAGVLTAIKNALKSYRQDHGNFDWFQLNVPATQDKIRLAAEDNLVREGKMCLENFLSVETPACEI